MAHVLFMDVVGYSKLPMDVQQETISELQSTVRATTSYQKAKQADELISLPTGDGMALAFFGDVEAPVHCALQISEALKNGSGIQLRMGIHSGPVYRVEDINAARNVAGGGINIAQRVMDCGDAGHILLSKATAENLLQVRAWADTLQDFGEAEVKHGVHVHVYNLCIECMGNAELPQKLQAARQVAAHANPKSRVKRIFAAAVGAGLLSTIAGILFFSQTHRAHALTSKDTIVVGDFVNKTGDPVFDDTLKEGLAVELRQSPFLSLISDEKAGQTLKLMGRGPEDRLTPEVTREVCIRTNTTAMLTGIISSLGSQYVIGIKAVNCNSGDTLAEEQVQAESKESVLKVMDKAATSLRTKLGESIGTVKKFDAPLEQATTPSLEALQAYSRGVASLTRGTVPASVPLFKRAIELDPDFAMAYVYLGLSYSSLLEDELANDSFNKAFRLKERVSQQEKYAIYGAYYNLVTGEIEKANQDFEEWAETYPRDCGPLSTLSSNYATVGEYEKSLSEALEAVRICPDQGNNWSALIGSYIALGRLQEAKAAYQQASSHNPDNPYLHAARYQIAFLQQDSPEMQRQVDWGTGNSDFAKVILLYFASDTEAYSGHFHKARDLSRQVAAIAKQTVTSGMAGGTLLDIVSCEAEVGNTALARQRVTSLANSIGSARDQRAWAALALARAGDTARAQAMADELSRRWPLNTTLNQYSLPAIRAAIALNRNDPEQAITLLNSTSSTELGTVLGGNLYPAYLRGEAYLKLGDGKHAGIEFQKLIDHRWTVGFFVLGALAHLQLGRAEAMAGDKAAARKAYQDFLELWKDADPDIPILKQAKAEYTKLRE